MQVFFTLYKSLAKENKRICYTYAEKQGVGLKVGYQWSFSKLGSELMSFNIFIYDPGTKSKNVLMKFADGIRVRVTINTKQHLNIV